ncbi:MAG: hypothetical protein ACOX21_01770 [Bacillota bacterium]
MEIKLAKDSQFSLKNVPLRKVFKIFITFLLLTLLVAPVVLIYCISQGEMAQYKPSSVPRIGEQAYGEILPVFVMDMQETVTLSGVVVSNETIFIELPKKASEIRFIVNAGDVVIEGDVIGYLGGEPFIAEKSGYIEKIDSWSADPYIQMQSLDNLALSCSVSSIQAKQLTREGAKLMTADGMELRLIKQGKVEDMEGRVEYLFSFSGGGFNLGHTIEQLIVKTGLVYQEALVVNKKCVYQLEDGGPYFVRTVDESGKYIAQVEVEIGYSNDEYICINGISVGTLCDSGYGLLFSDRNE